MTCRAGKEKTRPENPNCFIRRRRWNGPRLKRAPQGVFELVSPKSDQVVNGIAYSLRLEHAHVLTLF
jgi:hypothetical protein